MPHTCNTRIISFSFTFIQWAVFVCLVRAASISFEDTLITIAAFFFFNGMSRMNLFLSICVCSLRFSWPFCFVLLLAVFHLVRVIGWVWRLLFYSVHKLVSFLCFALLSFGTLIKGLYDSCRVTSNLVNHSSLEVTVSLPSSQARETHSTFPIYHQLNFWLNKVFIFTSTKIKT